MKRDIKFLMVFIALINFLTIICKKEKFDIFKEKPGFFTFEWEIINNQRILVTLDVKASGWVAFGVSKHGFMKNSDTIIGFIDSNNKPVVEDRFSTENAAPSLDTDKGGKNDILDILGSYTDGRLKITFSKPLLANSIDDNGNDFSIERGDLIPVIFAYKDGDNSLGKHTEMSSHQLLLWPNEEVNSNVTTDVKVVEVNTSDSNSVLRNLFNIICLIIIVLTI